MIRPRPATHALLALAAAGALLALPTAAISAPSGKVRVVRVEVLSGDTLGKIASRHAVSIKDLRRWNKGSIGKGDLIRVGDVLQIHLPEEVARASEGGWEGFYHLQHGDTLGKVAKKLDVSVADLRAWNNLKPKAVIRAGDMIRYRKPGKAPEPHSYGRPMDGRLIGGRHIGEGTGYRLRFPKNAFGMPRVLETLQRCAAHVKTVHPGSADILVGDISRPQGGRFPPHVSHQSGRDADVGYYIAGNKQNATMYRVRPHDIDHAKTWSMIKCWLTSDRVVRIYMDTAIQKRMAKELLDKKLATPAQVDRLFEARSQAPSKALVRHAPSHDTHIHVRFACDEDDDLCQEERADAVFRFEG